MVKLKKNQTFHKRNQNINPESKESGSKLKLWKIIGKITFQSNVKLKTNFLKCTKEINTNIIQSKTRGLNQISRQNKSTTWMF